MLKNKPDISVVIPNYNSRTTIRVCLQSILKQSLPKERYEVIVVDSSTDETPEIIQNEFDSVRFIHRERKTLPGPARNIGIQNAQAGLIMFMDSDCIAKYDTLERVLRRHREGDYAGVGGSVVNGFPFSPIGWADHLLSFSPFLPSMKENVVYHIPTCNVCYKAEVLHKLGLFPTYDFITHDFMGDDLIFSWKITSNGGQILFDPSIEMVHLNRVKFKSYTAHQWKLGWSAALVARCTELPTKLFTTYPVLSVFLPMVRSGSIIWRLLHRDIKSLSIMVFIFPLYLLGVLYWAGGFYKGAILNEDKFKEAISKKI